MRASGLRISSLILILVSMMSGSLLWSPPPASDPSVLTSSPASPVSTPQPLTLADIQQRGTLTMLMHHDAASYFLYRGEEFGFEYELARGFAQQLGVALQVRTPPPGVAPIRWLLEGKGDVAAGVIITDSVSPSHVRFSDAYVATNVQVITHAENPLIPALLHKADTEPHSAQNLQASPAPFALSSKPLDTTALLDTRLNDTPVPLLQTLLSDGLSGLTLSATVKKQVPFAPALAPVAELAQTVAPGTLHRVYTLPEPAKIGWAVRAEQTELLDTINQYHAQTKRSGLRKILYEKYFTTARFLRSDESTAFSNRLSQHDPLIAQYAEQAGFDWRLIAALIFEESRFDPKRKSRRGARGLMQVTRIAAREVGVKDFRTLHGNLEAGVKYLRFLLNQFPNGHAQDRLAFAFSGYLLGPSRVREAQRLAELLGTDPSHWEGSVEDAFPLLEDPEYYQQIDADFAPGSQAVRYANAILKRYELYTRYIPREFPVVDSASPQITQEKRLTARD